MRQLSPEFRLAAACCRWPPGPDRDTVVRASTGGIDWPRFLAVARRQRVEGLVNDALRHAGSPVPPDVAGELSSTGAQIARLNLAFAAESRRIALEFGRDGLAFLFVKGASLDMLAYGTLALKRARDIDLLVAREDVARTCALLADAGYHRVLPGPEVSAERFPRWLELCKETSWRHPLSGILVELHTALVDNPLLLPGVDAAAPSQIVDLGGGISVRTLRTEELFAYLCVHGATHAWSRLKWIADVAALLSRFEPPQIERLYRRSLELGVGRCSGQALLLCHRLFETELPPALLDELRGDRVLRWLAGLALGAMAGSDAHTELDDTVFGTVPIHLSHFALGRGWRFKSAELRRKLTNHEDQSKISLPRPFHVLYPLISVPSWLYRRVRGPQRPA